MDLQWINLSFYRFCDLGDASALRELRVKLKAFTATLEMKGTVLIASEGINAMVSGTETSINEFKTYCSLNLGVEPSSYKTAHDSPSSFKRMLVKIKKEIIPVGSSSVRPALKTAARLSAQELRNWLDEGKPIVLLDTRNRYEVATGTFENAQTFEIDTSRDFTQNAIKHLNELKAQAETRPIVTFCTGGIRCEKASAVLLDLGLNNVYQLDGGILRYFEENGSKHFTGNCFVFDWRLAVDGNLHPAPRATELSKDTAGRHQIKDLT